MSSKKLHVIIVAALAFLLMLNGCAKEPEITPEPPTTAVTAAPHYPAVTPSPSAQPTPTPTPEPTPEPTPTPYNGPVNPLTGLPVDVDISEKRPIAVMINNLREAQPQCGVSQADIIYETLAEGGITRMLAIFSDVSDIGPIGSVRSSRDYYIDLAQGLDAVYVHAGGSPQAYSALSARHITHIDGVRGYYELFYRDEERVKTSAWEHAYFTTGELLSDLSAYSFRLDHEEGYECPLSFVDDGTPANGETVNTITVPFSDYKTGLFEYDAERGLYLISQYNSEYIDGNTGEQVGVTNVLVLRTSMGYISGDDAGRITVRMTGEGDGWFACGGKAVPIKWSKAAPEAPFVFTNEDGSELSFGRGTSYINIISTSKEPIFE